MEKGKILQVCAIDFSFEHLLAPLVRELTNEGYTVDVACEDTGRFDALRERGFRMIPVHISRKISLRSNWHTIRKLAQIMRNGKYDIVHVHTPIAALLARVAAKWARMPCVVYSAHGYYFHEGMSKTSYQFYFQIEKWAARLLTDLLFLQSREDYELSLHNRFLDEERIVWIGNGVDVNGRFQPTTIRDDQIRDLRDRYRVNAGDLVYMFTGRLVKEKGLMELAEAFHRLQQDYPNAKLLLVGEVLQSERDQSIRDWLAQVENNPSIIAAGYRKDIPALLAMSDVFVLPSYREGLPRSIIEAMAMGKPVIATDIRGCRELVQDGVNGYLVPKGDSDALYRSMKSLADHPEIRAAMGKRARAIAEAQYDECGVIRKQLSVLQGFYLPK